MGSPLEQRPALALTVALPGRAPVLDPVLDAMQRRLDHLHVPAAVSLEVVPAPADAASRMVVTIDGVPLEVTATAGDVAYSLDRAFHRARELAITPAVVHALWRNWFGENECPTQVFGAVRRLLRDGVRWGFRLDRLRSAANALRSGATDVPLLFEEAVGEIETEIAIRAHPELHVQLDGRRLQESLFAQLGLYVHMPKIVADAQLDVGELEVRCTDLLLPRERNVVGDPGDAVTAAVSAHAGAFMTSRLTGFYLAQLWRACPRVVENVLKRVAERPLTRVLRHLLDEGISIRDLRTISDGLLNVSGVSSVSNVDRIVFQPETSFAYPVAAMTDPARLQADDYAECARIALRRWISNVHRSPGRTLQTYLLELDFERRVAAVRGALSDQDARAFVGAVRAAIADCAQRPVILTALEVRRHVRRLLERDLPEVAVLSYQELVADTEIQPISKITPPA